MADAAKRNPQPTPPPGGGSDDTMELKLYNTLTRSKEVFTPLQPGRVGIYTCGPTVYAEAHIGNLRSYVFPDLLKKTLRRLGYAVTHVVNITDVGHLTSDADTGEDKLERAARQAQRSAWEIAAQYTERFFEDLARLHIDPPDVAPRAAGEIPAELRERIAAISPRYARLHGHIAEQIALIRRLEEIGLTYRTDDGVYFDTGRFPDYGRMARLRVEGLQEGVRVEMGGKRHKTDFALWKLSPPDVQRQMEWDSPWGRGFPGWHIECSAMSMAYLGESFDIHTGGSDHIPVHHTNEIAQSEGATGHPFVRYWLHGEHLVLGEDTRMGKSEGNFISLQTLVEQGFEPLAYRYLVLNNHYRSYLNFSLEALRAADKALMGLRKLLLDAGGQPGAAPPHDAQPAGAREQELLADLCDDLNTPRALATLWTALRDPALSDAEKLHLGAYAEGVLSLGLFDFARLEARQDVPDAIRTLAAQRWDARRAKDFAASDRLRDEIARHGYVVRDRKDGYDLEKAQA
ncbi:MAG TPA: cysteine--tRNA ligase [bacterium]